MHLVNLVLGVLLVLRGAEAFLSLLAESYPRSCLMYMALKNDLLIRAAKGHPVERTPVSPHNQW